MRFTGYWEYFLGLFIRRSRSFRCFCLMIQCERMNLKSAFQYWSHLRLLKIFILFTSYFLPDGFWRKWFLVSKNLTLLVMKKILESVLQRILGPFALSFYLDVCSNPKLYCLPFATLVRHGTLEVY